MASIQKGKKKTISLIVNLIDSTISSAKRESHAFDIFGLSAIFTYGTTNRWLFLLLPVSILELLKYQPYVNY